MQKRPPSAPHSTGIGLSRVQDARWRRGETVSQKTARDQMISLEAVASSQLAFQPRGYAGAQSRRLNAG
jgi:hypothetical protein